MAPEQPTCAEVGTTARKRIIAPPSIAKPDIESLEAYTAQPIPPKDYTPQIVALCIGASALGLATSIALADPGATVAATCWVG